MTIDSDPIELFDVQGTTDLATKAEITRSLRATGRKISDRTFTYYASEGLIPKALRVGSRSGAYPKIVEDLLGWIIDEREKGLALEAISELVPLWRYLFRSWRLGAYDVNEIELIARQHVRRPDANREVPMLIASMTRVNSLCRECLPDQTWILKNGERKQLADESDLRLNFVLTEFDTEKREGHVVAWTQLVLPGMGLPAEDDPATIWLGSPIGAQICCSGREDLDRVQAPSDQKEVMATS